MPVRGSGGGLHVAGAYSGLLADAEWRAEIVEQMRALHTLESLPSRSVSQAIFAHEDSAGRVGFDEVNARLEESDQNLFAQAVLADDGEITREEVTAAIVSMRWCRHHRITGR